MDNYCLYVLKCGKNDALYTGITVDLDKRINRHLSGKGAKYTRSFNPTAVTVMAEGLSREYALHLENLFKKLTRKLKLVALKQLKCKWRTL